MNRLEWVLGFLLVVLLLAVVGVSVLLWFRPDPATAPVVEGNGSVAAGVIAAPTSVYRGETAMLAFAHALEAAIQWDDEARLVDAAATWPQGADEAALRQGQADWTYTFYAPDQGQTGLFKVTGGRASLVSEAPNPDLSALPDVGGWTIDSARAMDIFLAQGGLQFWRTEGTTTLVMKLDLSTPGEPITWFVSLFGNQTGNSLSMRIDATSGAVLEIEQFP